MSSLASIRFVATHFNELEVAYAFLGAASLPLIVDCADALEIRPTLDVDLSVEVATLGEHYALEERLRARGFQHDTRHGAPICRWLAEGGNGGHHAYRGTSPRHGQQVVQGSGAACRTAEPG